MSRHIWIALLIMGLLVVSGCTDIEDMIEEATKQEITVSRTIHNDTSLRNFKSATVMEAVSVNVGSSLAAGAVGISTLAERIEVSRLGLGEVRFFIKGHFRNQSEHSALVTISAIPNGDPGGQPVVIGTVSLSAGETFQLENPNDMDQGSETIHENLSAVFCNLDEAYLVNPIVEVQGAASGKVAIDWIKFSALPTYWRVGDLSPGSLVSYKKNVKRVYKATLEGAVINNGDQLAEVRVYISQGKEIDPEDDLIAHAFLEAGEKIQGFEMLLDGGATKIKDAFENMVEGTAMTYDFVVVSKQPLEVKSKNLRIQAKLSVEADIF